MWLIGEAPLSGSARSIALMELDGQIDGDWFEADVTRGLMSKMRPGDAAIMDSL